ncbi:MAG: phosphotransferase [Candidatus Obscuribacterales bacterium]|nr:phosphotransferase [Candidatus Obscuribacterales bacterium]
MKPNPYQNQDQNQENPSLKLLDPPPVEKLTSWLEKFYDKDIEIARRAVLRHRDFSYVERLYFDDALPDSLIYKLVLPPWDIEQDLHQRILIPSISSSAQLFMTAHHGKLTAMFLEDLGESYLKDNASQDNARRLGEELAKMHRAYSYRVEELTQINVVPRLNPTDFASFANGIGERLTGWGVISQVESESLTKVAGKAAQLLASEPVSLVHGDLYAENIVRRGEKLFFIDWSWFTIISSPLLDLASLASDHEKNGALREHRNLLIEAYGYESGRALADIENCLPYAHALERILFLNWLVERKKRGVTGTTVGHVDDLIKKIVGGIGKANESLA